jgi:hypothetical protein
VELAGRQENGLVKAFNSASVSYDAGEARAKWPYAIVADPVNPKDNELWSVVEKIVVLMMKKCQICNKILPRHTWVNQFGVCYDPECAKRAAALPQWPAKMTVPTVTGNTEKGGEIRGKPILIEESASHGWEQQEERYDLTRRMFRYIKLSEMGATQNNAGLGLCADLLSPNALLFYKKMHSDTHVQFLKIKNELSEAGAAGMVGYGPKLLNGWNREALRTRNIYKRDAGLILSYVRTNSLEKKFSTTAMPNRAERTAKLRLILPSILNTLCHVT